ncbi:MAG TPA: tetratricopeptide repeat protein [Candidatus Sulfotelmatobacter sp.]|nr:tetratricopeptide repeat protein [Candidatus Sulfotelmatobacter sp.]
MVITPSEQSRVELSLVSNPRKIAVSGFSALAVLYAFFAGFHTLQDFDLGWQLATGRWVVEHHRVFSTDVFSYTAAGQPWIYPALSGVIFYFVYLFGGYALLSWVGGLVSALTIGLLCFNHKGHEGARRENLGKIVVPVLAVFAAPLIANRTQPRAEMFTTILFATFLTLLWSHFRSRRSALWLLPILMVLWVNLHPGFIAGIALCIAYLLTEVLELPSRVRRGPALSRLKRAWPWLALTAAATLVNPWGPAMYGAVLRQQSAQALHNLWIVEWEGVHLSAASLQQALDFRDPQSSFWWLLVLAVTGVCIGLWRKQWGAVLLLGGAIYFGLEHVRLQALFACIVVVIGGALLDEPFPRLAYSARREASQSDLYSRPHLGLVVLGIAVLSLTALRSADLISNRYYLRFSQRSIFGAGLSWWFPERAVDFVQREKLPANLFNGYALGGYLAWRLFPAYRDYIDSRALPFGQELFFRAYDLASEPPDSAAWRQEADSSGINTIIVPLSRYQGMTLFPQLHAFCRSQSWRPVYLDEVAAVFVRATEQNAPLIARLQIDCGKVTFSSSESAQSKSGSFNYAANAGGVLYSLERYPEALAQLDRAQSIFSGNASVHLFRALVLQEMNRPAEAESEFRTSLSLEPTDEGWFDFGLFFMTQRRYAEAAEIFSKSAESSSRPHEMWMMLGQAYVQGRQPQQALEAFDKAVTTSPFAGDGQPLGASFNSLIAAGRANAWYQLGDLAQAVSFQEEAVRLAPEDAALWRGLADIYEVQGRTTKAAEARSRARALGSH